MDDAKEARCVDCVERVAYRSETIAFVESEDAKELDNLLSYHEGCTHDVILAMLASISTQRLHETIILQAEDP